MHVQYLYLLQLIVPIMSGDAFITEVKVASDGSKDDANPLLDAVTKDYKKLREVVQVFSKKV